MLELVTKMQYKKRYKSDLRIGTRRPGEMKIIVKGIFMDSVLYFEVDEINKEYKVGLMHDVNIRALDKFIKDWPLCKVTLYKPIPFSDIKSASGSFS